MDPLSVIFAGTGDFGVPVLEALLRDPTIRIPFVITGEDKPAGRGLKTAFSGIKTLAIKNKIIVHQPGRISEMKQKLIQEESDFFLVVAYGEIIKKDLLDIPQYGSVNIHASLLPKYRGASPIQETLLHGDIETGITWILMNERMDQGDIIAQRSLVIEDDDTSKTLSEKLSRFAASTSARLLIDYSKTHLSIPQNESQASFCKKILKDDGRIDFEKETAEKIVRKVKAYTPWPGVFFMYNGKRIKITSAAIGEQKISSSEIVIQDSKILAIGTQKGALLPARVQPESKREMSIEEFLRGQQNLPKKVG